MNDKPNIIVKRFAEYAIDFHESEEQKSDDPATKQLHKDLREKHYKDFRRYHNLLDSRISEGREKHNRGKKMTRDENLAEARAVYRDGDSGEMLRRKLAGRSIIVSARTARNYITQLKKR